MASDKRVIQKAKLAVKAVRRNECSKAAGNLKSAKYMLMDMHTYGLGSPQSERTYKRARSVYKRVCRK